MVELRDVEAAYRRIESIANWTPIHASRTLNDMLKCSVFLKCENFQRGGAFKFRGAYNAISQLSEEERERRVVASSSGNHAQAVALVSRLLGIKATIVMPENSVRVKVDATRGYGAKIVFCAPTQSGRDEAVGKLIDKHGYVLVHPFDNDDVIAGAGTAAYELIKEIGKLDYILCPIGGGGLISGTSIAAKGLMPKIKVIGVEPKGACDAYDSLRTGRLQPPRSAHTIADGLRVGLSERTFKIIQENVDRIVTVSDKEIVDAMRFLWERMKLVVEPSGATSLAGLLSKRIDVKGKRVGVIISGGNVDLGEFFRLISARIED
jgi:threonine dehydratase